MTAEENRARNRALCEKFPFLIPLTENARRERGKKLAPGYHYEYTELDFMPVGWRKAFGEQLCEELKRELDAAWMADEYYVLDIKGKYGALRWYGSWENDRIAQIIGKYEKLSAKTCINCGKPATRVTKGWALPICDECFVDPRFSGLGQTS